jgi:UTP--glucose-1-phosphate uridylyltransferase
VAPVTKVIVPFLGGGEGRFAEPPEHPEGMPPAGQKPAVQGFFAEVGRAGLRHVFFVTGRSEPQAVGFREGGVEFLSLLGGSGSGLLPQSQERPLNFSCVRQSSLRGLADAVRTARYLVDGEDFVVASGGTVIEGPGGEGFLAELVRCHRANAAAVTLAVAESTAEEVPACGVVTPGATNGSFSRVTDIVERASPAGELNQLAVAGRCVFSPEIFDVIENVPPRPDGQVHLSDCLRELIDQDAPVYCVKLPPGTKERASGPLAGFVRRLLDFAFAGGGCSLGPREPAAKSAG